jgi:uncharacterized protein YjbJ (UPF0337 family)
MNATQVSGITKNILGKFQEKAGIFMGNREQQMTGLQKQHMAKAETNLGNARELIKNAIDQEQRSKRAINSLRITT